MRDKLKLAQLVGAVLVLVVLLTFAVIGAFSLWKKYATKDYDEHLTEQVYVETALHQNVNLVFYKTGCPYCQAGKEAVLAAAEESDYPTFYIDVESEVGQELVNEYQVEVAATIIQIRDGVDQEFVYAKQTSKGDYVADTATIEEALNE